MFKSLEFMAKCPAYDGIIHIGIGMSFAASKMTEESFYLSAPEQAKLKELYISGSRRADEIIAKVALQVSKEMDKPVLVTSDMASTPGPENVAWQVLNSEGRIVYPTPDCSAPGHGLSRPVPPTIKRIE